MIKNLRLKKLQRRLSSGLNFSKIYFKKPISIVLITSYATILILLLAILGFSKLINPVKSDDSIPSLPESETFAFLPADNLEVPVLGDTDTKEPSTEKTTSKETTKDTSKEPIKNTTSPSNTPTPVVVEKEVVKTVEVPKEVVKTVEKKVVKEVIKETPVHIEQENPPQPEQVYYDNYDMPEGIPYTPPESPKNFPDTEDSAEEVDNSSEEPESPEE